jgi:hypothetical protein
MSAEEMERKMQITVNGDLHDIPHAPISYTAIAALAGDPDAKYLTITYVGPRSGDMQRSGILAPGEQIEPSDGLRFDACYTGNA